MSKRNCDAIAISSDSDDEKLGKKTFKSENSASNEPPTTMKNEIIDKNQPNSSQVP